MELTAEKVAGSGIKSTENQIVIWYELNVL